MLTYAAIWRRLCASILDTLILAPVWLLYEVLAGQSRQAAFLLEIPSTLLLYGYFVIFHALFGWTLGKRVMGVRVVRRDGTPIGWREAWWRSLLEVPSYVVDLYVAFAALSAVSDEEYEAGASWMLGNNATAAYEPEWYAAFVWTWLVLLVAECVVALFNRERRALHDFIAGTVVVNDRRS